MSKILIIETCRECKYQSDDGERCTKSRSINLPGMGRPLLFDKKIPQWCPLDDNEIYPWKDMITDIEAAFGNRANNPSISDADLLRQIYETLEGSHDKKS